MILQRLFRSATTLSAMRFLLGLMAAACLLVGTATWNWSMTGDAFGQISQGKITVLRDATLATGPDAHRPPADATPIKLPHYFKETSPEFVDYQLALQVQASPLNASRMALCVPRWSAKASVWIDGHSIFSQAHERLNAIDLLRPAFVPLPIDLSPGEHRIDIRLQNVNGTFPGLSEVWFGEHNNLEKQCGRLQDLQIGVRIGGLFLMLFILFVSVFVYASLRDDLSLCFVLMSLSLGLYTAVSLGWLGFLDERSQIIWFMVTSTANGFISIFAVLRLLNIRRRSLDKGLLGVVVLAYAVLAWLPIADSQTWLAFVGLFQLPTTCVLAFMLMWHAASKSHFWSDYGFALTMFFGVAANVMDIARAQGLWPYPVLSMAYWVSPLLALAIGLLSIERLVRYLRYRKEAAEQLKKELAEQRTALLASNNALSQQREKILLSEERHRLVSDMHDGLGSQLVSASALLKSGHRQDALAQEVSDLIDHALLDLRSMLDVFSNHQLADAAGSEDTVSVLLGMLRHRLAPVFRSQNIAFDWQSEALPHDFLVSDRERLQLLRLLQEAFSNIIKHAKASTIALKSHVSDNVIVFEVSDDGQGIDTANAGAVKRGGHGMANMADRAARLGAQLQLESSAKGTSVRVVFKR